MLAGFSLVFFTSHPWGWEWLRGRMINNEANLLTCFGFGFFWGPCGGPLRSCEGGAGGGETIFEGYRVI